MRSLILLPISAMMITVSGCQPEAREQTRLSLPERDVTLPDRGVPVEVASLVELQARTDQGAQRSRPRSRPGRVPNSAPVESTPAPQIVATPPAAMPEPAATVEEPLSDRELPPGKTITLIPASSGPSTSPDYVDEAPSDWRGTFVRVGARCPPRNRPGIGIATGLGPQFR